MLLIKTNTTKKFKKLNSINQMLRSKYNIYLSLALADQFFPPRPVCCLTLNNNTQADGDSKAKNNGK